MPTIIAPKLTYWELREMPNDGKRYELVDGEVYMSPSPNRKHQRAVGNIYLALANFVRRESRGEVYLAPFDVVFNERNVTQPDLVFILNERLSIITSANVWGVPDLAVEVLSPGTAGYDRDTKLPLYARSGIPELWYVDPEAETVEVFNLASDARYVLTERAAGEKPLTSSVLPGLVLTPHEIFAVGK